MFMRPKWLSLNGTWEFQGRRRRFPPINTLPREPLPDTITVPFPVEAEASGARQWSGRRHMRYRKLVHVPRSSPDARVHLHVGAADADCNVWINGSNVFYHHGGFTPFTCSIGEWLKHDWTLEGHNQIDLEVIETRDPRLPRGKQTHLPFSHTVFYPPFSGVWQSVWIEETGDSYLHPVQPFPNGDATSFLFRGTLSGAPRGTLHIALTLASGEPAGEASAALMESSFEVSLTPTILRRWSPEDPHLYQVTYRWVHEGTLLDEAEGYAGLRSIQVRDGRIRLNDNPIFLKFVLYQPYYPGGWVTPLDDEQLYRDMALVRSMGFNGIRIHQNVAHPRLLYWCDQLGILVWAEVPSCFPLSVVDEHQFENLLTEMIRRDAGHPSIITWVLFNESWGLKSVNRDQHKREWLAEMVALTRTLDPSRLVIDNSGFEHLETDVLDVHHYLTRPKAVIRLYEALRDPQSLRRRWWHALYMVAPSRVVKAPLLKGVSYEGQPVVISECGGFGFGPYSSGKQTLEDSLQTVIGLLASHDHIQGFCYTQLFDVAQETNGLCSFDRVPKVSPDFVAELLSRWP